MPDKKVNPIYVTKPSLPPLEEVIGSLEQIWESSILTNNGPFHKKFERDLADFLGVEHISLFSNGTLALITAIQALKITGEVITTPFSFVATTHALWWNNVIPVFADIDPQTFNLDPQRVEEAITKKTKAILPVHVYGNPCNVDELSQIAKKYNLKLIYDAAHAFGVRRDNTPVIKFGDLSILSFHATKVFNTFEGGAIISPDEKTKKRIDHLKNFGFNGETEIIEPGINAKMNEFQAALGLVQLRHYESYLEERKRIASIYNEELRNVTGITRSVYNDGIEYNYSYYPILIDSNKFGVDRDRVYESLKEINVFTRRYFYPLISHINPYSKYVSAKAENLPVSERVASEVLCLPIYPGLLVEDQERIVELVKKMKR